MSETKLTGATERDDVDTIIDGWVSQRPDLAPEPFAIFRGSCGSHVTWNGCVKQYLRAMG